MLNDKQKRHLKALAHDRKPIVIVGANGLTEAVLAELEGALTYHELVKVRVNAEDRETREAMIELMCEAAHADFVQRVGHVATLFRRNAEKPRIVLP